MPYSVVEKIKHAFEDLKNDRKTLVRVLSVILILMIAAVLRIHDSAKADITIGSAEVNEKSEGSEGAEAASEGIRSICVDIGGAVANPGVYHVDEDTRLYEVIDMAGGLAEDADTDSVNRAAFVEDGQKIIIPVKGSEGPAGTVNNNSITSSSAEEQGLININTASLDELKTLNGVGDTIAERIIEYRASHVFKSKEDIMSVDGIGKGIYEKIKDRIIC